MITTPGPTRQAVPPTTYEVVRRQLAEQERLRDTVAADRRRSVTPEARAMAALVEARRRGLSHDHEDMMS